MNNIYIDEIVKLAMKSSKNDEIPVGAIIIKNNKIIGKGINSRTVNKDVSGHAEINALKEASNFLGDWRLDGCIMYVTLFPCMMCTGAIVDSRIKKVYYLCNRTNTYLEYANGLLFEKINNEKMCDKYRKLLGLFFENKRK